MAKVLELLIFPSHPVETLWSMMKIAEYKGNDFYKDPTKEKFKEGFKHEITMLGLKKADRKKLEKCLEENLDMFYYYAVGRYDGENNSKRR